MYANICPSIQNVQPVPQPASEVVQREPAAVSLEPDSNINLLPQPTPNVVSSSSGTYGQQADAALPVTVEAPSADIQTTQVASSLPSQLRSSKRSTQRAPKSSHKSGSVSDGLLVVLALHASLVSFQYARSSNALPSWG